MNEAYKTESFYDVEFAYAKKEDALAKLDEIVKEIESGTSHYFPDTKVEGKEWPFPLDIKRYTFAWLGEGGERMFSHFYVREKELL